MSRSYKKTPYCGEKKHMKDYANRVVRNHLKHDRDLANGNAYKKLYERWDICDWEFRESFEQYKLSYVYDKATGLYYYILWNGHVLETYTKEQLYQEWYKCYKRKQVLNMLWAFLILAVLFVISPFIYLWLVSYDEDRPFVSMEKGEIDKYYNDPRKTRK